MDIQNMDEQKRHEALNSGLKPEVLEPVQETREVKEAAEIQEPGLDKELRANIERMDLDDGLKTQANSQAQQMKSLADDAKLAKLLDDAKKKGVIYAVTVAKKMDPYILDSLHDLLAKEGYYKNFLK
jgi:hypothetical protein